MTVSNTTKHTTITLLTLLALLAPTRTFLCPKESDALKTTDWYKIYRRKTGIISMCKPGTAIIESKGYEATEYMIRINKKEELKKVKKVLLYGGIGNQRRIDRYILAEKIDDLQLDYMDGDPDRKHFVEELYDIKCVRGDQNEFTNIFKVNPRKEISLLSYTMDDQFREFFDVYEHRLQVYRGILEDLKIIQGFNLTACVVNPKYVFIEKLETGFNPVLGQTEFFREGTDTCEAPFKQFSPPEIYFGERYLKQIDENKINVFNVGLIILFMEAYIFSQNFQSDDVTSDPSEGFKKVKLTDQLEEITDCDGQIGCYDIFNILMKVMIKRIGELESQRVDSKLQKKDALPVYTKQDYPKFLNNIKAIGKILQEEKKSQRKFSEGSTVKVSGMLGRSSNKDASQIFMNHYNDLLKLSYKMMKKNKDRPTYDEAIEELKNLETKYKEFLGKIEQAEEERRLLRLV